MTPDDQREAGRFVGRSAAGLVAVLLAALAVAVLVVVAVAAARLYRGAHFPTDVVGSILFAVAWLILTTVALLRPRNVPAERRSLSGAGRLRDRDPLEDG